MQIIHKDIKKGIVKVKAINKDDIWYLSNILERGDIIKGRTERKIKLGEAGDRKQKVVVRYVTLAINAEKVEFHKYTNDLRVSGKIIEGCEDIPKGSYHTFNIEENSIITIEKPKWMSYQIKRLEEAALNRPSNILICIFDREEAIFAIMKKYGYEILSQIKGVVQKKAVDEKIKSTFYEEIIKMLGEYDKKYQLTKIILASPAFWKEELGKEMKNSPLLKKVIYATTNSVDSTGINEVLKRPEVISAIKEDRIVREVNLVNELLGEIKKEGLAVYGIQETKKAADVGAVKILLVTDDLARGAEQIMKEVDNAQGEVHIISTEHEAGKTLKGLGGIGGILRYRIG